MDSAEAQFLLERSLAERQQAQIAISTATATIESTELIIQGILRRFPDLSSMVKDLETFGTDGRPSERLRGSPAVLSILQVNENHWMTIAEMVNALDRQGLLPETSNPPNAVRAAVERLVISEGSNVWKDRDNSGTVIYRYCEPERRSAGEYQYEEEPF